MYLKRDKGPFLVWLTERGIDDQRGLENIYVSGKRVYKPCNSCDMTKEKIGIQVKLCLT